MVRAAEKMLGNRFSDLAAGLEEIFSDLVVLAGEKMLSYRFSDLVAELEEIVFQI